MSTRSQMETVDFEDIMSSKVSTLGTSATREDVLKAMYFRSRHIIVPTDITVEQSESAQKSNTVLSLPKFHAVPEQVVTRFSLLQEWEGCVQCVGDNEFTASLLDMTNKKNIEEEEVDFPIDDLNEDDKRLLKPGAIFRWLIGYRSIAGSKERISKIVFRRMPQWTAKDLQAAQAKAKHISSTIIWE